jgi:hypothetical protein
MYHNIIKNLILLSYYRVKSDSNVYSDDRSDCMKIVVADCKKYNFVDMIVLIRRNQALI